jgi:hypothetical protein
MSVTRNPVLWLAWGLPVVAVVACVVTLFVTLRNPDGQLPEQYHWEGFQLDRDFSRAAKAAELHVNASLSGFDASGRCSLRLRMEGPAPHELTLLVAHATKPELDQRVTFRSLPRDAGWNNAATEYTGECHPAREGHWRLELIDTMNGWAVRRSVRGSPAGVTLDAMTGQNE